VYKCDLNIRADVLSVVQQICVEDGHDIDIFVHCGGIQHREVAEAFPEDRWDDILNVNLTSAFLLSRELASHWLKTSLRTERGKTLPIGMRKKIIFIASVTAFTGSVQIPAYVSSKGAITALTRSLSNEWMGKGINVNSLAPGYIETELTKGIREDGEKERAVLDRVPLGRWGEPEDLAGAIVHLASRSSDFIGGEVFVVDGGFNAR
jgi:2-deoxy-D-gluconate 3-dehydrogenase